MKKQKQKPKIFDPYVHLSEIILVALVLITAFFVIWFLYNVVIMETTDEVIIGPFGNFIQFIKTYFPYKFVQDAWEQQKMVGRILYEGYLALLKSIGIR